MLLSRLNLVLKCLLVGLSCLLALRAVALLEALTSETNARAWAVRELPATLDAAIAREASETRKLLGASVAVVSDRLDGRLASVQGMADDRLRSMQAAADLRLASLGVTADSRLASIEADLVPVVNHATGLLDRYREVPDQLAWATAEIWDCTGNPRCIENQYVKVADAATAITRAVPPITDSVQRSSAAFADGFPKLLNSSNKVADNVERMTHPRWYDRLLSGGVTGGLTYLGR